MRQMTYVNRMTGITLAVMALVLLLGTVSCSTPQAQGPTPILYSTYEPSVDFPYGRINPDAADNVNDYAFMIGDWTCKERQRNSGEWNTFESSMKAQYYLNGFGILNFTWTPAAASLMSYLYDATKDTWTITNTVGPRASHSIWIGGREGENRIATSQSVGPDGRQVTLQIGFYDVTDTTFSWRLAVVSPNGLYSLREKTCARA